jgi:hypothetical protein
MEYSVLYHENPWELPWCTIIYINHIAEHPNLYSVYTIIYWVYTSLRRYMLVCCDMHVQIIFKKCHDMGIRTVNLMHTARLTSRLDLERWCANSFLHGISILLVVSSCTSPAGWCQKSGVDVQCEHTKRVTSTHLPSKRTLCIHTASLSSGRTSGTKSHSSRTQARTRAAEDTSHALVLLHTGMGNTQGQSYAKALRCRIHARPSSYNFTAPGRRKTAVDFIREASSWRSRPRLIYP